MAPKPEIPCCQGAVRPVESWVELLSEKAANQSILSDARAAVAACSTARNTRFTESCVNYPYDNYDNHDKSESCVNYPYDNYDNHDKSESYVNDPRR